MPYPIHIAFCVNNGYVPYITVAIRSIADSHPNTQVTVHVLSDDVTEKSKERILTEVERKPNINIVFHDVDDTPLTGLKAWSKYTWYRLLLPSVLPADVSRVLYLDADTLVCDDLSPLFDIDMTDMAVAGVIDPMTVESSTYERCGYDESKQYICAGVMLVNLDYWRRNNLQNRMVKWGLENVDIKFHDQDCINFICQDSKVLLPIKYGVIDVLYNIEEFYNDPEMQKQLLAAVKRPAIIHYAGKAPWLKDGAEHPLAHLWHETNDKLRWKVRRSYKARGLTKLKIIVHDMLHPGFKRQDITLQEIKQRLINAKLLYDTAEHK